MPGCSVCSHSQCESINLALVSRAVPVTHLARQHNITRDLLNYHRRAHLQSQIQDDRSDPPAPTLLPHGGQNRAVRRGNTTGRARERFLKVYALCGNVTTAAKAAGIGRATVYVWAEHDDAFAQAMRQAELEATDVLEQEAWRRARDGVAEPVYQHGKLVGTVQRFSDALLVFLLKSRAPERFRDRIDVGGQVIVKAVAGFDPASVV